MKAAARPGKDREFLESILLDRPERRWSGSSDTRSGRCGSCRYGR